MRRCGLCKRASCRARFELAGDCHKHVQLLRPTRFQATTQKSCNKRASIVASLRARSYLGVKPQGGLQWRQHLGYWRGREICSLNPRGFDLWREYRFEASTAASERWSRDSTARLALSLAPLQLKAPNQPGESRELSRSSRGVRVDWIGRSAPEIIIQLVVARLAREFCTTKGN